MKQHADPELAAVWTATPTSNRYTIAGVKHVLIKRGNRTQVIALDDLTPSEIKRLIDRA